MRLCSNQSSERLTANSLTLVGLMRVSIGTGHQREAVRLRRVAVLGHERDRGERGDAGLAHREEMRPRPEHLEKADHVIDELVEAEAALAQRHVARIVPVGDVDVVVRQHGV